MKSTNSVASAAKRIALVFAFAGMLLSLPVFGVLSPQNASAGWNGQQIQVNYCYATKITFSGVNQRGESTVATFNTSNGTTKTTNYWWVGSVKITSYSAIGTTVGWVDVPKVQITSDWKVKNACT